LQLIDRINSFEALGNGINFDPEQALEGNEWEQIAQNAVLHNGWFTPENVREALLAIKTNYLNKKKLLAFSKAQKIPDENAAPKTIGLVMAGNIPLVGFQDLLYVLLTGNKAQLKLSSKDEFLSKFIISKLIEIEPKWKDCISIQERLSNFDAIIATGSNNTSRYFDYYFSKYPNIIRKNRNSVAVLNGNEDETTLKNLGKDLFNYFGLGCRNVSQLLVPEDYDFKPMLRVFEEEFSDLKNQHKYKNNYDYQLSLLLINSIPHMASENLIITENEQVASPISCLYYQAYKTVDDMLHYLHQKKEQIQCIVSELPGIKNAIACGNSQQPGLNDFADNVNVIDFLLNNRVLWNSFYRFYFL